MKYSSLVLGITIMCLIQACSVLTEPRQPLNGAIGRVDLQPPPDDSGGSGGQPGTWPYFAPQGLYPYEAPDPPNAASNGIWLGWSVTPDACFGDRTLVLVDRDYDLLHDTCELELAKGFAPHWGMASGDACPQGEPYWAAKYFPSSQIVRIAFLPAYYRDCGSLGHDGDSEFVMVEVAWNATTLRWEFQRMWISAHWGAPNDRSQWANASQTTFTGRYLGFPYVEVSKNKHANYTSWSNCVQTAVDLDTCNNDTQLPLAFRFPIVANRNVGSRLKDLVNCVLSVDPNRAANGRRECFYVESAFKGWNTGSSSSTAYRQNLMSNHFELRQSCQYIGSCSDDWGPSQSAPIIQGPTALKANESGTWMVSWIKPLNYCRWFVDGIIVKQGTCTYTRAFADAQSRTHRLYVETEDAAYELFTTVPFDVYVQVVGHQEPPPDYNINSKGGVTPLSPLLTFKRLAP